MKILGKEFQLAYNLRSQFIFESITGKSFSVDNLLDQYILFYSCILAVKDQTLDFDEFIDWCNEHPETYAEFGEFMDAEVKKRQLMDVKKK